MIELTAEEERELELLNDDLIHGRCRFCGRKTYNGTDICKRCQVIK